jgi:hypothetical protein
VQTYRLYFRCRVGAIIGREDLLDAKDDTTALVISVQLFEACSDLAAGFELWHGPRLIGTSYARRPQIDGAASVNAETQARVARHEELLLDSHWAIAESRRLLALTGRTL